MNRSRRRPLAFSGPGNALLIVAALMIGSAILRLGLDAGPAIARTMAEEGATAAAQAPDPGRKVPDRDALQRLLTALQQREAEAARRETAIEDRMRALKIAEDAVDRKLEELARAEASLRETLAFSNVAAEEDLSVLTQVYQNMKPKDAAALFEEMDADFAAGFLGRMTPDAAAGIMAGLSPAAAYSISVVLAGRNASAPKD